MNAQRKIKGQSGNHPSVTAYRRKMESITEGTLPQLEALNARLDRALESAKDDRREPEEDPRRESTIPVDVVDLDGKEK